MGCHRAAVVYAEKGIGPLSHSWLSQGSATWCPLLSMELGARWKTGQGRNRLRPNANVGKLLCDPLALLSGSVGRSSMERVMWRGVQPMRESGHRRLEGLCSGHLHRGLYASQCPLRLDGLSWSTSCCKEPDANKMSCYKLCAEGVSPMGRTATLSLRALSLLSGGPSTASSPPTCQNVARPMTPCLGTRGEFQSGMIRGKVGYLGVF